MPLSKFIKIYLLPPEHGGWFLLLGPFLLGALAAGSPNFDLLMLAVASFAAYIARQPLIILVKAFAGRRARADIRPALYGFAGVGFVLLSAFTFLLARGHFYLLWLGVVAVLVLAWQLALVAQKQERQLSIELVGVGVLSLAAPAAYWVSLGASDARGWWLGAMSWWYAASAIGYVYLRLEQRRLSALPNWNERWRAGMRVLLYASVNFIAVLICSAFALIPIFAAIPYALALIHYFSGVARPCIGARPVQIGLEQSAATLLFYLLLGISYHL